MARRLLLTYLTITALTLAVVVVPLGRIFAHREYDRLTFGIERDAQVVASLVEDALETGRAVSIDNTLADYRRTGGRIVVVRTDGVSVADSDAVGGPPRDYSTRPEIAAALDGERRSGTRSSETLGTELIYVAVPVASGGTVHGAVRITYPTSTLHARVAATWWRLGLLATVVMAGVALVGVAFARSVTRPLRALEDASRRLAVGDLAARVHPGGGAPELRSLTDTFNATAHQLEQLVESQRRFVADASHQLRTPLTALRLRLETLAPFVDEGARSKLDAAIVEADRLGRLVQSLLVLARSDAAAPACDRVDLSTVVAGRTDAWAASAADSRVRLVSRCPSGVEVVAVPGAVEQILDNVLANALAASPAGTQVTIEVVVADGAVELHVVDEGPGMSAADREHAFERFWRQPGGVGGGQGGFGLGLAIVDQLARRCGGRVRLDPGRGGRGLDAVVTLPVTSPPTPDPAPPSPGHLQVLLRSGSDTAHERFPTVTLAGPSGPDDKEHDTWKDARRSRSPERLR